MRKQIIYTPAIGAIILLVALPLTIGFRDNWEPNPSEFTVSYCGIIVNSISLIIVAATLFYQYQLIKLQREQLSKLEESNDKNFKIAADTYDSLILGMIKELQSESTEVTRRHASCFREYLKTSTNREELEKIFQHVITDSWGTKEEYQEILNTDFYKEFHAFTTLARYFDTLSYYEFNQMTANAIHYYYVWWRESFLIYKFIYNEVYIRTEHKHFSFIPNWISMTDRMDAKLKAHQLLLE